MVDQPTLPSESTPDQIPVAVSSHTFTGNPSVRSIAAGGVTQRSDTPLPLRTVDPAIYASWDQPQPQMPQRSPPFTPGGPAEPPFPPPVHADVPIRGVEAKTEVGAIEAVGQASGAGRAEGVSSTIVEAVGHAEGIRITPPAAELRVETGALNVNIERRIVKAPANGYSFNGDSVAISVPFEAAQSSFQMLQARVAVLEKALASKPTLVGHNGGPSLDANLNVDEAEIQKLIALLKDQSASGPVDKEKLTEAAMVADPTFNKWRDRLDMVVKGALFGVGKKTGEELANQLEMAAWFQSVYSALQGVFEAISTWLSLFF